MCDEKEKHEEKWEIRCCSFLSLFLPYVHKHKQRKLFTNTNNWEFFLLSLLLFMSQNIIYVFLRNFIFLIEMFFFTFLSMDERKFNKLLYLGCASGKKVCMRTATKGTHSSICCTATVLQAIVRVQQKNSNYSSRMNNIRTYTQAHSNIWQRFSPLNNMQIAIWMRTKMRFCKIQTKTLSHSHSEVQHAIALFTIV